MTRTPPQGKPCVLKRIDTGWTSGFTADKSVQTIYGIRYINDVVCRRLDHDADGDYSDEGSKTYYHLTDNQFSTVAILDQNAVLLERVSYDAYGRARHHRACDFTGDGAVSSSDQLAVIGNWGNSGKGDSNRDGVVNVTDLNAVIADWGAGATLGVLPPAGGVGGVANHGELALDWP